MKLAIFDFDGTIYRHETFALMMTHLKKLDPRRYRRFYARILPIYLGYKIKLVPERKMKSMLMEQYVRALDGVDTSEIDAYFAEIVNGMHGDMNEEVLQKLKQLKQDGYFTLIVSGAFTPMLASFAEAYPVDKVIGTELTAKSETFSHVHAEKKVELIMARFQDADIDWANSYAFGDSLADLSVLKLVGNPVAVCPDEALQRIASDEDWDVVD